jgi:hypothetical protein
MKRRIIFLTAINLLLIALLLLSCTSLAEEEATQTEEPSNPSAGSIPSVAPAAGPLINQGNLIAANSEVTIIKTAASNYRTITGNWPRNSIDLIINGYLDREPEETYTFDQNTGKIRGVTSSGRWITNGFTFDVATQKWK